MTTEYEERLTFRNKELVSENQRLSDQIDELQATIRANHAPDNGGEIARQNVRIEQLESAIDQIRKLLVVYEGANREAEDVAAHLVVIRAKDIVDNLSSSQHPSTEGSLNMASTFERIAKMIDNQFNVRSGVTRETSFKDDLAFDSLDEVEFVMEIEKEFGIDISDDEIEGIETVGQAVDKIDLKLVR